MSLGLKTLEGRYWIRRYARQGRGSDVFVDDTAVIRQAYQSETPRLDTIGDGVPAPGFWVNAWIFVPKNADERQSLVDSRPLK